MSPHDLFILIHLLDLLITGVLVHQLTTTWLTSTAVRVLDGEPLEAFAEALREERWFFFIVGVILTLLFGFSDDWMLSPIVAALGFLLPTYISTFLDIKKMRKG